jgi:hypothetical protein
MANQRKSAGIWALTIACAIAFSLAGCAVSQAPIDTKPKVVATPQQGQVTVTVQAQKTVGSVTPVYISVANGTESPQAIVPTQVFALNESGERIAPIPPGEAARQSGNAQELKACLASAGVSGALAGGVGAGLGAAAGSVLGGVGTGAVVGAAAGAGWGMFRGVERGQDRADQQAAVQIQSVSLQPEEVRKNFTVSGYVFFPKGQYSQVEMLMVDRETGDTESIREPWR